jgi:hypothetical protein
MTLNILRRNLNEINKVPRQWPNVLADKIHRLADIPFNSQHQHCVVYSPEGPPITSISWVHIDYPQVVCLGGMLEPPFDGHTLVYSKAGYPDHGASSYRYSRWVCDRWYGRVGIARGRGSGGGK